MLNLLEYELNDVAKLLDEIPTKVVQHKCFECGSKEWISQDSTVETIDTMNREFVRVLVERIGAIYDVARARELRDAK